GGARAPEPGARGDRNEEEILGRPVTEHRVAGEPRGEREAHRGERGAIAEDGGCSEADLGTVHEAICGRPGRPSFSAFPAPTPCLVGALQFMRGGGGCERRGRRPESEFGKK